MAEAIDGLDVERPRATGVDVKPVRLLQMRDQSSQPSAWQDSARQSFSTATVDRFPAKIVVEADDAERLRFGDVERLRDQRNRRGVDVAEALLQFVQDRQHRAALGAPRLD